MTKIPVCKKCNLVAWTDNLCIIHLGWFHAISPIVFPEYIKGSTGIKKGSGRPPRRSLYGG